jgi:hypothetical protein
MRNRGLIYVFLVISLIGCIGRSEVGREGEPCFKNGFCFEGLVCDPVSRICVKDGSIDGGVDAGYKDTEVLDTNVEEIKDYGLDVFDAGEDVEEIKDYREDVALDVEDIVDNILVDVEDVYVDTEDVVEDITDISLDAEEDVSDISGDTVSDVISDVCIPNCTNKECGDDGCGGICGNCGDNAVCNSNKCECKSGFGNCNDRLDDGCEANFSTDPHHCSDCATDCGDNSLCNNKTCACQIGYANCDGLWSNGCEKNLTNDGNNCGVCGKMCGTNAICYNSSCLCDSGYGNCDNDWSNGCEVNLNSINSCGTSCSNRIVCLTTNGTNPVCDNGVCRLTCNSGYMDCNAIAGASDGCEIDLNNPVSCGTNCGDIKNCGANSVCNSGFCGCINGYYDCNGNLSDGCEKQLDPKHLWSKKFGGSNSDYGQSVSVDSSGNIYITGRFLSSTIDFGGGALTNAGSWDIFLAKFDSNGNHKWSKIFGGGNGDEGNSVSVDSTGNVYITGMFASSTIDFGGGALTNAGGYDIFLAKFDSNGNHLWSKSFGGSGNDWGKSVSVDSSGNVYITGGFNSTTIDFGGGALTNANNNGTSDIFLAKFDSNGNHKWSKVFGGDYHDYGNSVSVDSSGNVYITGMFASSTIDFGGGVLTNAGNNDIFLAKFDSNGNHKWSKRFGGSIDDNGNSVSVDSSGNVYITGYFQSSTIDFGGGALTNGGYYGSYNIFLAKFDSNGNHKWSKRFGGSSNDFGYSVSVDSSSNVYITGYFDFTIDFGGGALTSAGYISIFLAKFDSNGNHLWSKRFGRSDYDYGYSVYVDSSGNLYGTGYFSSSNIDFGGCPMSSAGNADIYLIKYAP